MYSIIVITINGCIKPETPESYVSKHNDKELAIGFSKLLNNKSVYTYARKDTIKADTNIVPFSAKVPLGSARNYLMENGQNNSIFNTYLMFTFYEYSLI